MKVKIIFVEICGTFEEQYSKLEDKVNEFIKDKDVISVEWDGRGYRFIVVYE